MVVAKEAGNDADDDAALTSRVVRVEAGAMQALRIARIPATPHTLKTRTR